METRQKVQGKTIGKSQVTEKTYRGVLALPRNMERHWGNLQRDVKDPQSISVGNR